VKFVATRRDDPKNRHELAVAMREQLHREQPQNVEFTLDLATSYRQAAVYANHKHLPEEVLLWNGKVIALAQEILVREERHVGARLHVVGAAGGKAQTLTQLGRHAESLEFWDLALKYANGARRDLLQTYPSILVTLRYCTAKYFNGILIIGWTSITIGTHIPSHKHVMNYDVTPFNAFFALQRSTGLGSPKTCRYSLKASRSKV
jgi:tetratricopeptide (TPR) repeat protein